MQVYTGNIIAKYTFDNYNSSAYSFQNSITGSYDFVRYWTWFTTVTQTTDSVYSGNAVVTWYDVSGNNPESLVCGPFTIPATTGYSYAFWYKCEVGLSNTSIWIKTGGFIVSSIQLKNINQITTAYTNNYNSTLSYNTDISTNVLDGNWHHIAVVASPFQASGYIKIYVDNLLYSSPTINTSYYYAANQFTLQFFAPASSASNLIQRQYIDEVQVFNNQLSSTEVGYIYNNLSVPSSPIITSVELGSSSVFLNFTPGFNGNSPITTYYYSTNGTTFINANTTASPIKVTGLTNGNTYSTFYLMATNVIGNSIAANITGSYTPSITYSNFGVQFTVGSLTGTYNVAVPLSGTSNITVDWGDGTADTSLSHTYATDGTYNVYINGSATTLGSNWAGSAYILSKVLQWKNFGLTTINGAFQNCYNLTNVPTDLPKGVTNLSSLFGGCIKFNQDISMWDVSAVTNMQYMFNNAQTYNQPLNSWNVGNVTNMQYMFQSTFKFNQPLNNWNVGKVTNMSYMFEGARLFNQDLNNWDVRKVTNMSNMFQGGVFNANISTWKTSSLTNPNGLFAHNSRFNQPIDADPVNGYWDMSGCTTLAYVFYNASSFNQPINNWNTKNATSMYNTFYGASSFNQPLDNWNVSKVTDFAYSFWNASSFNQPVNTWNVSSATSMHAVFNGTFNQPLSNWNMGNVVDAGYMFAGGSFNQDIPNWDMRNCSTFDSMFNQSKFNGSVANWKLPTNKTFNMRMLFGSTPFNQPLTTNPATGAWDMSGCVNISYMFQGTTAFNQDLSSWNTQNVTDMGYIFYGAAEFNMPIGSWNTTKVTNLNNAFQYSVKFNQDLSNWTLSSVTNINEMITNAAAFTTDSLDKMLVGWSNKVVAPNMVLSASVNYSVRSIIAVSKLRNAPNNWTITATMSTTSPSFAVVLNITDYTKPISIPISNYSDIIADWGDGTSGSMLTHTYSDNGYYALVLDGSATTLGGSWTTNSALVEVANWGSLGWTDLSGAFRDCSNLVGAPNNIPSTVTNISYMFAGDVSFNSTNITSWTTTNITRMDGVFQNASIFNRNIGSWNTTNVVSTRNMFNGAAAFNQNITSWNMAKNKDMAYMFANTVAFNQAIGSWNVAQVTNMDGMFQNTAAFNQSLNAWDTGNVVSMANMFNAAAKYNSPMPNWNISKVANPGFIGFLNNATTFNVSNLNYTLRKWSTLTLQPNVVFDGANQQYNEATQSIMNTITAAYNWSFRYFQSKSSFVMRFDVSNASFRTITLPISGPIGPGIIVYWGDGTSDLTNYTHTYAATGIYYISIEPLPNSLLTYYKFNTADISGNVYVANYKTGVADWSPSVAGVLNTVGLINASGGFQTGDAALNLDASTNITQPTRKMIVPEVPFDRNYDITFSFWARINVNNVYSAFFHFAPHLVGEYYWGAAANMQSHFNNTFYLNTYQQYWSSTQIPLEQWQHYVFAIGTNGTSKFYINGNLNVSFYGNYIVPGYTSFLYNAIGGRYVTAHDTTAFRGQIDEFLIYNRTLTAAEIATLYAKGVPMNAGKLTTFGNVVAGWTGNNMLTDILGFGDLGIQNFSYAFKNCTNLQTIPQTLLSGATNMSNMFYGCSKLVPYMSNWNVASVTTMAGMLTGVSNISSFAMEAVLNNWATQSVQYNVIMDMSGIYIDGTSIGYNILIAAPYYWKINVSYTIPPIPCFLEGTRILCLKNGQEQYIPIQNLRSGDRVKTVAHGYVPVALIGKTLLYNTGDDERRKHRLYKCTAKKYPELIDDLYITGCHSILTDRLSNEEREKTIEDLGDIYTTDGRYRLMAFIDKRARPYKKAGTFTIWHLALENADYYGNYGIYANGLLVESCSKRYMSELSGMCILRD